MKRGLCVCAVIPVLAITLAAFPLHAKLANSSWPMFRHDIGQGHDEVTERSRGALAKGCHAPCELLTRGLSNRCRGEGLVSLLRRLCVRSNEYPLLPPQYPPCEQAYDSAFPV